MANSKMKFGMHGIASRGKSHFAGALRAGAVLILWHCLWCGASVRAEDAEDAGTPRPNRTNYASFQSVLRDQMHASSELPRETRDEPNAGNWQAVLVTVEIAVCLVLSLRLLLPRIGKLLDKRLNSVTAGLAEAKAAIMEEKAVTDFATELQVQPKGLAEAEEQRKAILDEFFQAVPGQLKALRNLFAEIGGKAEPSVRQKALGDLNSEVTALKNRVGSLELTPAWQLASSLERLLGQLSEKPANITPSTLRTAAGGLLLLKDLCVPDVRKDIATNPPVRFLAVDDEPISRRAVSMSLKKIAQAPDLAEHGEEALKLAEHHAYDAVFLDVEMPGLDGFEVCTKIHQFEGNRLTPVVFVTSHSDFDSREKSISSGGRDLIAKPFLSAEITLKALTLLMRARLEREKAGLESSAKETSQGVAKAETKAVVATKETLHEPRTAAVSETSRNKVQGPNARFQNVEAANEPSDKVSAPSKQAETAQAAIARALKKAASKTQPETNASTTERDPKPEPAGEKAKDSPPPDAQEFAKAFAVHGAEHLREIQHQISALRAANGPAERQEILAELYVGLNMVRSEAARAGLQAICELASALGKLVLKLLEKPALFTPSALQAITAAIELLEELAPGGAGADLANPPVRALVVDDEPLTRRAMSNALQLTFGKPDTAENGEAAVVLAQSKVFDVIFLDIMMPDMDGFQTCAKIRETKFNGATPIIFVTSHKDSESRDKSFGCGGNGFISKPVLPTEIFLTALTFTLRARMGNKKATAEVLEEAVC
jgi:CheY-like chemotaxis protein